MVTLHLGDDHPLPAPPLSQQDHSQEAVRGMSGVSGIQPFFLKTGLRFISNLIRKPDPIRQKCLDSPGFGSMKKTVRSGGQ